MTTADPLVHSYLGRLDRAAALLPPDRRAELLAEIAEHIAAARPADEAALRTVLDRLGSPEEIVAAAREDLPPAPPLVPRPAGTGLELAAVLLLTVGSLLPLVGWCVGVALLWSSRLWTRREKVLATVLVPLGPGGLFYAALLVNGLSGEQSCTSTEVAGPDGPSGVVTCTGTATPVSWVETAVPVVLIGIGVLLAVVLLRTARARAATQPPVWGPVASPWGGLEIAGVLLLAVGGVVVPVVSTVVGLVLVCSSRAWTAREKVLAAVLALLPTALVVGAYATSSLTALGSLGLLGVLLLGPLLGAASLLVALNRRA